MTASRPNESENAIAALIETCRQGFLRLDPELLGSIWDREHDPLVYVAMERPGPIYGWPAIKRYYEACRNILSKCWPRPSMTSE